jgi:hypothetical protein
LKPVCITAASVPTWARPFNSLFFKVSIGFSLSFRLFQFGEIH